MRQPIRLVTALGAGALLAGLLPLLATHSPVTLAAGTPALHVSGNHLLDAGGNVVVLRGVNRMGTEYACQQGWGIFDGPSDAASVQAMAAWGINAVRIPVNEGCWLGIQGTSSSYNGTTYQNAIVAYAHTLEQYGIHPIIDDQAQAPGNEAPTNILPLPDKDHAPAFWTSVATAFKGDDAVLFNLKNEPHDGNWSCWRGGTCTETDYNNNTYTTIGFQDLITTVRNTGATNVIVLDGEGWANDLTQWLAYEPSDPQGNLMAGFHVYPFNGCTNQACWNSQLLPVAQQVPLYFEEFNDTNSQNGGTSDDGTTFNRDVWTWADQHGIGYLMWTWNTTNDWQAIVSNYNGTPTSYDGQAYHDHLAALMQAPTATPVTTATATKAAATATATQAAATATPRAAAPTATTTPSALTVHVKSASANPATVGRGSATTLAATVISNRALSGAIVDFEVYNTAGTKLYQTYRSPISFAANSAKTVKATWTVPTNLSTGSYALKIGVFGPNWSPLYTWDNNAATIAVQ